MVVWLLTLRVLGVKVGCWVGAGRSCWPVVHLVGFEVARRESRGAHQRRDFPALSPDLLVNFQTRLDADGHLTVDSQPAPLAPPQLAEWVDASEEPSVAGRLLE
jgi:hypothetical protein